MGDRMIARLFLVALVTAITVLTVACDDSGDDAAADTTPTAAAETPTEAASPTVERPSPADITPVVNRAGDEAWTEDDARAVLEAALLKPADIAVGAFVVQSDATQTNADAAQANPEDAASIERCGRLLSRTLTMLAEDTLNAFLGGETLSFFSTAIVYSDEAGAIDCSNEAAAEFTADPTALARQFGPVFVDPAAVTILPVEYPMVADGSFAATLTGQTNSNGTILDLTILIVAFRSGNVSAVVGSARSAQDPPTEELAPYVDLVLARIEANQQ